MVSYISKHTILSMMSSGQNFVEFPEYHIRINQNTVKVFSIKNLEYFIDKYQDIRFLYLENKVQDTQNYKLTSVIGGIFDNYFFDLNGKHYKKLRCARNRFDNELQIFENPKRIDDIFLLIDTWKKQYGIKKYFRTCHSGYDTNFFSNFYNIEKDSLFCQFFYNNEILVGYSIISKIELAPNIFAYMLGKAIPNYSNSLGFYIDFKTFQNFFRFLGKSFYVHWGASKGTLLKYKLNKFPVESMNPVWNAKLKIEKENTLF